MKLFKTEFQKKSKTQELTFAPFLCFYTREKYDSI